MDRLKSIANRLNLVLLGSFLALFGVFYVVNGQIQKLYIEDVNQTISHLAEHTSHSEHLNRVTQEMMNSVRSMIIKVKLLKKVPDHHNETVEEKREFWEDTLHKPFHSDYEEAVAVVNKMLKTDLEQEDKKLLEQHLVLLKEFRDIGHGIVTKTEKLSPEKLDLELSKLREKGYDLNWGVLQHHKRHIQKFKESKLQLSQSHKAVSSYLGASYLIAAIIAILLTYFVGSLTNRLKGVEV